MRHTVHLVERTKVLNTPSPAGLACSHLAEAAQKPRRSRVCSFYVRPFDKVSLITNLLSGMTEQRQQQFYGFRFISVAPVRSADALQKRERRFESWRWKRLWSLPGDGSVDIK